MWVFFIEKVLGFAVARIFETCAVHMKPEYTISKPQVSKDQDPYVFHLMSGLVFCGATVGLKYNFCRIKICQNLIIHDLEVQFLLFLKG